MTRTPLSTRTLLAVVVAVVLVIAGIAVVANVSSPSGTPDGNAAPSSSAAPVDPYDPSLSLAADADRKHRAAQITSTFENATLELQYDYAEDIGDGRGITAGRAGFTSATNDLLRVVRRYTEMKPDNPVAEYLPVLEEVNGTDSTEGLEGFGEAWAEAAEDPDQRELQDAVVDELYFHPAMALAAETGIVTPLGQAIFWDTMIQHGAGGEHGTRAMIDETEERHGFVGEVEAEWLDSFLDVRLEHLYEAYEDTTDEIDSSQSRIGALRSLLEAGELALEPPLTWEVYGTRYTLTDT